MKRWWGKFVDKVFYVLQGNGKWYDINSMSYLKERKNGGKE